MNDKLRIKLILKSLTLGLLLSYYMLSIAMKFNFPSIEEIMENHLVAFFTIFLVVFISFLNNINLDKIEDLEKSVKKLEGKNENI